MNTHERLRRANPVPEPDRLLAAPDAMETFVLAVMERTEETGERLAESVKMEKPVAQRADRRRSSLLLIAAVAAITVAVAGALLVTTWLRPDPEPATPTPTEETAIVNAAYDALNAGDIRAWLDHFAADAEVFGASPTAARDLFEVLAAANYRAAIVEPCRRVDGRVTCTITETTDFYAAGGLSLTRTETFVVDEHGKIAEASARVVAITQPGYHVFTQAFYDWMRDAHPEVHAELRPRITTHLPPEPEQMRAALDYLDEFIAQSDVFPVDDR